MYLPECEVAPHGPAEANLLLLFYEMGTAWFVFLSNSIIGLQMRPCNCLTVFCHLLFIFLIPFFSPSHWPLLIVKSTAVAMCTEHTLTAAGLSWQTLEYIISAASSGSVAGSPITVLKVEGLVFSLLFISFLYTGIAEGPWSTHRKMGLGHFRVRNSAFFNL